MQLSMEAADEEQSLKSPRSEELWLVGVRAGFADSVGNVPASIILLVYSCGLELLLKETCGVNFPELERRT